MRKTTQFRKMLSAKDPITVPGAYDAWSARLIELAGFSAVYMTGYGVAASLLARPDIGLVSSTEEITVARNIAEAVKIPVIADLDNGYGNSLNVIRAVREAELASIACIQLEDQIFPKRCGHMEGKQLIPKKEMISKIKAAVYARQDPDLCIIARTDARAVMGLDDALDRAKAYEAAGADIIFVEAPQSLKEMERIAEEIRGPKLANMVENGKTPLLTKEQLAQMNYNVIIYPVTTLFVATKALMDALAILKRDEDSTGLLPQMVSFPEYLKIIELEKLRELEESFLK